MLQRYLYIIYKAAYNTISHDGVEHAGYMAFMNILSLFPFLVFIVALTGFIGETQFGLDFIKILLDSLPGDFISALKPRINEIVSGPPHGLLTLSILGAIWTSSTSVEGLRTILNRIYNVKSPPAYILRRLLSVVQFICLSLIIIFSMFLLLLLPIIYEKLIEIFGGQLQPLFKHFSIFDFLMPVWSFARESLLLFTLFLIVSCSYYILPNLKLSYKSVIPGSVIVIILWVITGTVIANYIGNYQQLNIIYGSLGGIIISMFFFYIINIIFIYGAEFNYLLSKGVKN